MIIYSIKLKIIQYLQDGQNLILKYPSTQLQFTYQTNELYFISFNSKELIQQLFKIYQSYLRAVKHNNFIIKQSMSHLKNFAFGLPSVPRQSMPSMYQILSWDDKNDHAPKPTQHIHRQIQPHSIQRALTPPEQVKQNIIENISEVKSQHQPCKGKKISKSCTKHHQLYEYKQPREKVQSQSHSTINKSKIETRQIAKPTPKKLDPNNENDLREIFARKKRIKSFELVTRELPNTAFTTYYGKPAFQAYGRGNSNPCLLSHNVMPHKGDNHPRSVQSYYSALLKGKRSASSANVSHIPRKPIEQIYVKTEKTEDQLIHIPLAKPDLINNIRFTASNVNEKKDSRIPTNKMTAIKQKVSQKSVRKQKKASKPKQKFQASDGLKYMNTRENLLKIIENKRLTASKLAYKVTDCYPCDWENEQKLKQSTKMWQNAKIAGVPSKKCQTVSDLLKRTSK